MGLIEESGRGRSAPADAAELLVRSRLAGTLFDRLPEALRPADEMEAYAVQDAAHARLVARGRGRLGGHKIGCTTAVMQAYLGIEQPCAGGVFAETIHHGRGWFAYPAEGRLGVECELAVTLERSLPPRTDAYRPVDVAEAIGASHCAIEVVADRYVDYHSLDTPTLIADDFFNHGIVLAPPDSELPPSALVDCAARMFVNGAEVGSGSGSDILGDPLSALAWLATMHGARGRALEAGEVVMLGSLVQTHWVEPGDGVAVECPELGRAEARFGRRTETPET